jgi:hypothetical protein
MMKTMSNGERTEFLAWYEEQNSVVFDNRRVLESCCQDDVTVLRQACRVFRCEFMRVGNIDVFQESFTIASACNKLRYLVLKPDTIGLIPTGGYTGNFNYSKKAIMRLVYRETTYGCHILHGINGREYTLPELPNLSVDGFCAETKTVFAFNGCYLHGHTRQPFHDITTVAGDTLAECYEMTMAQLAQITQSGYQVEVHWECDFDEGILAAHPELKTHPIVQHEPLYTRDALYGV